MCDEQTSLAAVQLRCAVTPRRILTFELLFEKRRQNNMRMSFLGSTICEFIAALFTLLAFNKKTTDFISSTLAECAGTQQ